MDSGIIDTLTAPLTLPTDLEDTDDYIDIISSCTGIIEVISAEASAPQQFSQRATQNMFDFAESTALPTTYDEEDTKTFAQAKAAIIKAIVEISEGISLDSFWATMRRWLDMTDREDLVDCALLSCGNSARDGE